jgi:Ca2+-binding EF-hand superfamily protein
MSNLFEEKNTTDKYLSQEIVPIINVPGIWFEESEVLDFTTDDSENYKQFLEDITPRLIADNSDTICLMGMINGMPPLVKDEKTRTKIENNAPIKGIAYSPKDQKTIKGYRSGTRSAVIRAKVYTQEEFEKLENKNNLWIIAKTGNKIYIPDEKEGNVLIRLKGSSMWTQKNQEEYKFPYVLLRPCDCYRYDKDPTKKYIEVRGFNSTNASARELYGIREVKPYFDKLNILVGNLPLGFWKYMNLKDDPSPKIEKCVCVLETLGDKRVETHFLCGSEKILKDLIPEETCKNLLEKINQIYKIRNSRIEKQKQGVYNKSTLEQDLYTYLKSKYGLKSLIIEWNINILSSIQSYIKLNSEVYLFASILKNELDEDSIEILNKIKKTLNNILNLIYDYDVNMVERVKQNKEFLRENEWKIISKCLYSDDNNLRVKFVNKVSNFIDNLIKGQDLVAKTGKKILFSDFLNILIRFNLRLRKKYLHNLFLLFSQQDPKRRGIINLEGFKNIIKNCRIIDDEQKAEEIANDLIEIADKEGSGQITFNDTVQCLDNLDLIMDEGKIKFLDKLSKMNLVE